MGKNFQFSSRDRARLLLLLGEVMLPSQETYEHKEEARLQFPDASEDNGKMRISLIDCSHPG